MTYAQVNCLLIHFVVFIEKYDVEDYFWNCTGKVNGLNQAFECFPQICWEKWKEWYSLGESEFCTVKDTPQLSDLKGPGTSKLDWRYFEYNKIDSKSWIKIDLQI